MSLGDLESCGFCAFLWRVGFTALFFIMGFLVLVYGSRFNLCVVLLSLFFWEKSFSIHGIASSVLFLVCGLDVDPGSL